MVRIDRRILAATLTWAALSLALVACSGKLPLLPARKAPAPAVPTDVQLSIVASPDVNPDSSGRASPVQVDVYQLRDAGAFMSADFDAVTTQAASTLGSALLDMQKKMVPTGASVVLPLKIDPQTRMLGVVAEFSDLSGGHWRITSALPTGGSRKASKTQTLRIRVDHQTVSVVTGAAGKRS